MKLQLMSEDISLALEEQSVSGLRRIPRAVAEIDRVEHDTKSLQSRIQGILRRLDDAEGASRDAVRTLASCLLYTSPSPRDGLLSRMPSSA